MKRLSILYKKTTIGKTAIVEIVQVFTIHA